MPFGDLQPDKRIRPLYRVISVLEIMTTRPPCVNDAVFHPLEDDTSRAPHRNHFVFRRAIINWNVDGNGCILRRTRLNHVNVVGLLVATSVIDRHGLNGISKFRSSKHLKCLFFQSTPVPNTQSHQARVSIRECFDVHVWKCICQLDREFIFADVHCFLAVTV